MREITTCSRRNFVRGAALGAAGLAAVGLTACAQPAAKDSMADAGEGAAPELAPADETWETDVLVIGLGASGLQAALGAAAQGVGVLAVDQAPDMVGTTNITTSGYLCVGDKLQMAQPYHYEVREVFDKLNEYSNYCFNTQVLKAILDASSRSSNNLIDAGLPVKVVELPERKELTGPTLGQICGHAYDCKGQERADIFQAALDKAGVDSRYGVTAEQLVFDGDEIVGVRCTQDGKAVDVNAKAICLCTGGFLGNEDMVAQYFAGSRVVPMGNPACKGAGITMALSAKGQMGKAFSLSSNEYGGANFDASPMFAFRPGSGSNEALRLVLLGSIIVDSQGNRFVSEEIANKEAMHCAEPFIRAKTYYTVVDQDFIDYVKSKPLGETHGRRPHEEDVRRRDDRDLGRRPGGGAGRGLGGEGRHYRRAGRGLRPARSGEHYRDLQRLLRDRGGRAVLQRARVPAQGGHAAVLHRAVVPGRLAHPGRREVRRQLPGGGR